MTDAETWLAHNDDYLSTAVKWIHLRLRRLAGEKPVLATPVSQSAVSTTQPGAAALDVQLSLEKGGWFSRFLRENSLQEPHAVMGEDKPPTALPLPEGDPIEEYAARLKAAAGESVPPASVWLQQTLGLSDFELHTLLLCAVMELDTSTADLCAKVQRASMGTVQAYPTFALAMSLFDNPAWDILSPERPLRYWRLIEITQPSGQALTISQLRVDERILNFLKGLNYLDDRLTPYLLPILPPSRLAGQRTADLSRSQDEMAGEIAYRLVAGRSVSSGPEDTRMFPREPNVRLPLVQLTGPDAAAKELVATEVARQLGCGLYRLPVAALPSQPGDLDQLARLWQREAALLPIGLYIDAVDLGGESQDRAISSLVERLLSRLHGLIFLTCREPWPGLGADALIMEVEHPTVVEQAEAWVEALGPDAGNIPFRLANQFSLGLQEISGIAARQVTLQQADLEGLWSACLERSRPRLDLLAERIEPRSGWNDLVLPPDSLRLLKEIAAQVDTRSVVYEEWGFRQKMSRGLGISALFAGESGVGKTMAAEVIAKELHLNLYRIDLSAVVSKYIGETEKNLRRLFDAADGGGAILFFDEADALFGKRSEVKDSHDRYANIEINYLLQRMEAYTGLAILATNMKSALDPAFTRRLRFIVNVPVPGPAERKSIWQKIFPADTPLELDDPAQKIDYNRLAKVNLTGGGIHNAALNAAFRAASAGSKVTMPLLIESIQTELKKSNRPITPI